MKTIASLVLVLTAFLAGCETQMGEPQTSSGSGGGAVDQDGADGQDGTDGATGQEGADGDDASGEESTTATTEGDSDDDVTTAGGEDASDEVTTAAGEETTLAGVAITDGDVELTAENTQIQFVGKHTDTTKPDRVGTFEDLSGTATVEGDTLSAVEITIQTESLTTDIGDLTNHLKSADFFDVLEHPEASFTSTSIEAGDAGTVNITGDLTLLGETKSITFPATVSTEDGLTVNAEFTIDRTEWGMTFGQEGVEKEIDLTVTIGE